MDIMEILREFKNIDKKIDVEVLSIKMGKDYATEFYNTIQGVSYGDKVQNSAYDDAVCCAAERLSEHERVKEQIRREEWQHLMEYRRLMQLKLFCMRALGELAEPDIEIIRERAMEARSWAQISAMHNYSESQSKRRYVKAMERFAAQYRLLLGGVRG